MNAPLRFASKACLVTAACGALSIQAAGLLAQDNAPAASGSPAAAKVVQAQANSQDGAGPGAPSGSQPESAVQRELRKKYNKEGREAPSMKLEDAPNTKLTNAPPKAAQGGVAGKSGPAVPPPAKPNWFERTFHVGRGRKSAANTQYAAPTPPPTAPYRYPSTAPAARPAQPPNRGLAAAPNGATPGTAVAARPAPVATGSAAAASPAQPQFREPAPLGPLPAARNLAERATPPTVRPARPQKDAQSLLDETEMNGDSESLELEDDAAKVAGEAPKVLSTETADGPADSPYSGLKIAPNETEKEYVASRPRTLPADESAGDKAASDELSNVTSRPITEEPAIPAAKPAPAAVASANPGKVEIDMHDDDDDDDGEDSLKLPASEPRQHADAAADKTARPIEKAAEMPAAPAPLSGLKGICPVVLKDNRKLQSAQPEIKSEFRGKTYTFSSVEAKQAFDENPRKYAPVGSGNDVVRLTSGETDVAGTLEHAAWYRGRLYLFSTADSRSEFVDTPSKFVIED